jgi:hypothetical protein
MTCRDFRRMADAFLSAQTTAETNHDILRHVDVCPSCRAELGGRRRLRAALRRAFSGAPELEPQTDFAERLRTHLREEAEPARRRAISHGWWLGLAAGVVMVIGLTGALIMNRSNSAVAALARDAIGDHRNCALKYRLARTPVPLPEAAARFDRAYRLLITSPPDEMPAPEGAVRVLERHACAYDGRRFGHVIMQYRGHVVSLLMTAGGTGLGGATAGAPIPHSIGPTTNGLSVVSIDAADRSILLVGDLGSAELTELSTIVATPLAQRLNGGVLSSANPVMAMALQTVQTRVVISK